MSESLIKTIKWDATGLVPAVAQDAVDGRVRMMAWMNAEAVIRTLETGYAHYWSRSRKTLWKKGESSGHLQRVKELRIDCDGDTVLLQVEQTGPACHTGAETCFYRQMDEEGGVADAPHLANTSAALDQVFQVIRQRRAEGDPQDSYVARLFDKGQDAILKKVAEEAGEVLLAAKGGNREQVVYEAADLIFHLLIALESAGSSPQEVATELARRFGTSGIAEKASRKK